MTGMAWPIDIEKRAERLVVEGVRRYMGGYSTGDIRCWEMAWELYASELGTEQARQPVSELSCYARALNKHATRHFCLFPYDCTKLCQDECLVTALVSAAQSEDSETVEVISSALVSPGGHKDTIFAATEFAAALKSCDLILNSVDLSSLTLEECPLRKLGQQHRRH
ncbi:hypothetical protein [Roseibium algae]|uniref:Uncharacterized protein n=1 Tax=Roseibium algae TaxID=3123038 RepID=A0ABU8TL55_9HYPH